jgi:hypothetical protein
MRKSVMVTMVVFLAMVAVVATASAAIVYDTRYPDIEITPSKSTNYSPGVFGAQLYEGRKQLLVFPGWTSLPSYDNEIWRIVEGMNKDNTPNVSEDGRTRWPSPWIFPGNTTTPATINYMYYVYGRSDVVALVMQAFTRGGYSCVENITADQIIDGKSGALVWSSSGAILFLPVTQASVRSGEVGRLGGMIDAFIAADTSLGQIGWNSVPLETPPG